MKRTNKPIRNFQKKKYYTNRTKGFGLLVKTKNTRNKNPQEPEWEYFYDPLKKE